MTASYWLSAWFRDGAGAPPQPAEVALARPLNQRRSPPAWSISPGRPSTSESPPPRHLETRPPSRHPPPPSHPPPLARRMKSTWATAFASTVTGPAYDGSSQPAALAVERHLVAVGGDPHPVVAVRAGQVLQRRHHEPTHAAAPLPRPDHHPHHPGGEPGTDVRHRLVGGPQGDRSDRPGPRGPSRPGSAAARPARRRGRSPRSAGRGCRSLRRRASGGRRPRRPVPVGPQAARGTARDDPPRGTN